jgi:excisionase family DNA binding protein
MPVQSLRTGPVSDNSLPRPPAGGHRGHPNERTVAVDPLKRQVVSTAEAARLLCVTAATVRKLIRDEMLDTVIDGMRVRVTLESVDAELARRYPTMVRRVEE